MLNDDSQSGTGETETPKDADALFDKLKGWIKLDYNSKGQVKWRKEAREDFDFEAGEQLSEDDKAILQDAKRPIVIFNRVGTTVDSVAGQEVGNRQEVQFIPRTARRRQGQRTADLGREVVPPAVRRRGRGIGRLPRHGCLRHGLDRDPSRLRGQSRGRSQD
jgi:hypothetical protein